MKHNEKLRTGFTTGTCAAAAVKAAVQMMFSQRPLHCVRLAVQGGREEVFTIEAVRMAPESVSCAVKKDAGDDPDITNGVFIYGSVRRLKSGEGQSYTDKPCYRSKVFSQILLTGGEGIGMVTKKGLPCEPGFFAINPVPRDMIMREAAAVCDRFGLPPDEILLIEISVPEGRVLAPRTFNPNLGIVGGISILGTSGIVNPMSEQALVETIRLDIRVKAQEGKRMLAVAPGNYGEAFLKEELGISMDSFVKCSNFIGDSLRMMREEDVEGALLAGHIGKLIKVAGGVLNTHSQYGDRRMEILSDCAREAGAPEALVIKLLSMNTTEEAVEYLKREDYLDAAVAVSLERIRKVLEEYSKISVEVVMFSNVLGILGMTAHAGDRLKKLHKADRE